MPPTLAELWNALLHRPARKTLSCAIPAERVTGETLQAPMDPDNPGYFQVRLAEMFAKDGRVLWKTLTPATLLVCEFKYAGDEVRSPVFVSNRMLQGADAGGPAVDKTHVRLHDTRIVGPVPYAGGDVAIFAGLFRTQIADHRKSLFNVLEKLFGGAAGGGLGAYLKLADKVSDELLGIFGMKDIECVLAERNVFGTALRPLGDGYFALLDIDERAFDATALHVHGGRLQRRVDGAMLPFDLCDYCLLRIETSATRTDYATLPFHEAFVQARKKLATRKVAEAKLALLDCLSAVEGSRDLSEDHRYRLIEYYQVEFLKARERYALLDAEPADEAHRGETDAMTAELELKRLLGRLDVHPELEQARSAIERIEAQLGEVEAGSDDRGEEPEAGMRDEGRIRRFLAQPRDRSQVSAAELVRALTVAMVDD
jgi:hypothetical protein